MEDEMALNKPKHNEEARRAAVAEVVSGKTYKEVARAYKVSIRTVANWVRKFRSGGNLGENRPKGPVRFSPEVRLKAIKLVESGMRVVDVAKTVSTSTQTIYNW